MAATEGIMSFGSVFDTIKDGLTETFDHVKNFYKPGKLGTWTKVLLTIATVMAIFMVVGSLTHEEKPSE